MSLPIYFNRRWHITPDMVVILNKIPGAFALLGGPIAMPEHAGKLWVCLPGGCHLSAYRSFAGTNWLACFESGALVPPYDVPIGREMPGAASDLETVVQYLGKEITS